MKKMVFCLMAMMGVLTLSAQLSDIEADIQMEVSRTEQ